MTARAITEALAEAGRLLIEIKEPMPHGAWLRWLDANVETLGFKARTAQALMNAAALANKANAQSTAHLDKPAALKISRQIWGHKGEGNHLAQGTGENEWYTPPEYIAMVRDVLGGIDLDPASSASANDTIGANEFFDEEADGLAQEWRGRVWLNPPYSKPLIGQFMAKLCEEVEALRCVAAIALTHNYTDTRWFQGAAAKASATCFTRGRVKFYSPAGEIAAPTQGQAFFYFCSDVSAFKRVFAPVGYVVVPA